MRQSTAQSRHQLLPARGACKWGIAAGRWCSDCGLEQQRIRTKATDADTTSARPIPVGTAAASAHQQQPWLPLHWQGVQPRSSLARRPIGVYRGRECGSQQPSHVISSSLHVVHAVHANDAQQQAAGAPVVASRPASALPSIEPLLRSSALTTKRASRARIASGDGLRATCSRSGSYRSQLRQR